MCSLDLFSDLYLFVIGQLIFVLKSKNDFGYKQVRGDKILNHSGKGYYLPANIESRCFFQHKQLKLWKR
jgi:hypothetical protein